MARTVMPVYTILVILCLSIHSIVAQTAVGPTPLKDVERFSLLIGIDDYAPDSLDRPTPLKGPSNDVKLIKDLLVSQYGFHEDPNHMKTLLGKDATRNAITQEFKTQLIDKAAAHPGAVMVFYFSGHGSQLYSTTNGEETTHDTLVAYDSRVNGNRDIIDSELIEWFEELRKYTPHITFILDSCHSGSAIKEVGTLTPKDLPRRQAHGLDLNLMWRNSSKAPDEDHILLTRRQQFALLSASLADEKSFEDEVDTPSGKQVNGLFTYYLVQTLKQRADITVEQATQIAGLALAKTRPYQHPQSVGYIENRIFGGTIGQNDSYIRILAQPTEGQFEINAGAIHGVREGAFLAIYAAAAQQLSGETQKIANARVIRVGALTSTAMVSDSGTVPLDSKIVLVTPFFGFEKLRIYIPDSFLDVAKVSNILSENQLVEFSNASGKYDVVIRLGCVNRNEFVLASDMARASACPLVYYLSPAEVDYKLLGFHVLATDPNASEKVAEKIEQYAKQTNVRGLNNASTLLQNEIALRLTNITVSCDPSTKIPIIHPEQNLGKDTARALKVGQDFQLTIENGSQRDLYAAVFMLGTSGKIELITTNSYGDKIRANSSITMYPPRRVGLPPGRETYKLFVTTSPSVDFRIIETPGGRKKGDISPLEWFFGQSTNPRTKDSTAFAGVGLDWATAAVDVDVRGVIPKPSDCAK